MKEIYESQLPHKDRIIEILYNDKLESLSGQGSSKINKLADSNDSSNDNFDFNSILEFVMNKLGDLQYSLQELSYREEIALGTVVILMIIAYLSITIIRYVLIYENKRFDAFIAKWPLLYKIFTFGRPFAKLDLFITALYILGLSTSLAYLNFYILYYNIH